MSRTNIRRRLSALTAMVRPADSLEARVARLRPDQRAEWEAHQARCDKWRARHTSPAAAYAAMIGDDPGPQLRTDVSEALFGPVPTFPEGISVEEAAEIYHKFLERCR